MTCRLAALVAAVLFTAPAAAQLQSAAAALAQDAGDYARVAGLPIDEAVRQLRAQDDTIAVTDGLAIEFADRLAGIAVAHRPYFAIDVLLTGDAPVAPRWTVGGGTAVPITFRTGAPATHARLVAALIAGQAAIRAALPHPPGLGVDPRAGGLTVFVTEADAARFAPDTLAARLTAIAGVPVALRIFDQQDEDSAAIAGGARVVGMEADGHRYLCTSGFVVTDGARDGIVTAAHCPDAADYVGPDGTRAPLTFVGQWGWSFQDVQLHLLPASAPADTMLLPAFYADTARTALRPVTASRPRASTRAGDIVCHRGERSGFSCAAVMTPDFAPAGDLCGGPCAPTWVAVDGRVCHGGDSGGPVFDGTVALGILKGGSYRPDGACAFWFYMAIDYLPTGWRVLTAPVAGSPGPAILPPPQDPDATLTPPAARP